MRLLIITIMAAWASIASAGDITNIPTPQHGDCVEDGTTLWCGDEKGHLWWCEPSSDHYTWECFSDDDEQVAWSTDCPECSPPTPRGNDEAAKRR